jgi:serine/threonine protein phosphatase PrpC
MNCEIAQETRVGARPYNEDRMGCWRTEQAALLVLADGLGGHANGDLAAELAVRCLVEGFRGAAQPRLADPDLFLFRSIGRAHSLLCAHAREHRLDETPRTTIVACVVQDGCAYWMHVGDSRLYLLRDGAVAARTADQTLVRELVASGRLSELEAESHPQRNVLLQCLGGPLPPRLEPAASVRLRRGDVLLLCSDGFSGPLRAGEIALGVRPQGLQGALAALASRAEARAGAQCDNVSVLALAWHEDYMTDAEIAREIERIRRAFRLEWALHAGAQES